MTFHKHGEDPEMSDRHDDYKMDWRKSRPAEPPQGEPKSLIDSWPFLAGLAVVVCSLLWAASQGWLP